MDVVLVRWPDESGRIAALRQQDDCARLLLVDGDVAPPLVTAPLEDWIRVPASEADVRARVDALQHRLDAHRRERADVDVHGVLRHGRTWVPLPPVEARLARALVERFGAVVSRDALGQAGWPDGSPGRNALDVHMLRLRRRVATVGLAIRTVRSRGYLLEASDSGQHHVREA